MGVKSFVIIRQGAWVLVQIFIGTELQWIHKYGGQHKVAALTGSIHQGQVTVMKIAHRRYKSDDQCLVA